MSKHDEGRPRQRCCGSIPLVNLAISLMLFATLPSVAAAHDIVHHSAEALALVGFDQRLNAKVPDELVFLDESARQIQLGEVMQGKPVFLAMTYFECDNLCPLVRQGLVDSLRDLSFSAGDEFDVVIVSIDPDETPMLASAIKAETIATYDRAGDEDGWHFLTGSHEAIDLLADAIGFRYAYDGELDEYAHASGIVLLTPSGKIARYFFGIDYSPRDLRLGLVEASQNRIGTAVDQLMLLCYHYNPAVGKYSLLIMNVLRIVGGLTVAGLVLLLFVLGRQNPHPGAT